MILRLAVLACISVIALSGCKPRRDLSGVQGVAEDQAQLVDRVGKPVESAEMLRPGPGFMQLKGDQQFLHKVRVHGLTKSARWDDLVLLSKTTAGAFALQEYSVSAQIAGSDVTWNIPALASFAAPLATRNLLVQLADGFYVFDKTVDVPPPEETEGASPQPKRLQYQATVRAFDLPSKIFDGSVKFLSVDLYSPNGTEGFSLAGEKTEEKKELPVDALGIGLGDEAPARHRPLYYIKNVVGPQVNGLDLTYGSLFVLTHEGQTAGSGFGVWLGPDITRDKLVDKTTSIIVLGNVASDADREKLKALAGTLASNPSRLISAKVAPGRSVSAFDSKGLVVGGFLPDSGMPIVASMTDYIARSSQKPAQDDAKAPIIGDTKSKAAVQPLPSKGAWKFVQYADGSKWSIYVNYHRVRPPGGGEYVEVDSITVYKDGYYDVRATSFERTTPSPSFAKYKREASWWYLEFERFTDGTFGCGIDYHIYGTPLFGWDSHVRKEGICK